MWIKRSIFSGMERLKPNFAVVERKSNFTHTNLSNNPKMHLLLCLASNSVDFWLFYEIWIFYTSTVVEAWRLDIWNMQLSSQRWLVGLHINYCAQCYALDRRVCMKLLCFATSSPFQLKYIYLKSFSVEILWSENSPDEIASNIIQ